MRLIFFYRIAHIKMCERLVWVSSYWMCECEHLHVSDWIDFVYQTASDSNFDDILRTTYPLDLWRDEVLHTEKQKNKMIFKLVRLPIASSSSACNFTVPEKCLIISTTAIKSGKKLQKFRWIALRRFMRVHPWLCRSWANGSRLVYVWEWTFS